MAVSTAVSPQTALRALLSTAIEADASDLHLVSGQMPRLRVHGELSARGAAISASELAIMLRGICPPGAGQHIIDLDDAEPTAPIGPRLYDLDFSHEDEFDGAVYRFRCNVFYAHGALGACFRLIPGEVPSPAWSGLPTDLLERLLALRNGLVLATGITGSGKSTTLAIILEQLVERRGCRVITIEEPVEYVHRFGSNALVTQREVGIDVPNFAAGLKHGLRQDPDVILVGEIRDQETAQMALTASETGHLVLSTMHTRDAQGAVSRFTDLFPRERTDEICAQLATNLRAVLSQHLVPHAMPGHRRVLAVETLFSNLPVRSAIRSNNLVALGDALMTGRSDGMMPLDESLAQLISAGKITFNVAAGYANEPSRLRAMSQRHAIGTAPVQPGGRRR